MNQSELHCHGEYTDLQLGYIAAVENVRVHLQERYHQTYQRCRKPVF